jgi:hypothetical protein
MNRKEAYLILCLIKAAYSYHGKGNAIDTRSTENMSSEDYGIINSGIIITLPKRCINKEADMLKNPCKSTRFYSDIRDRRFHLLCIPEKAGRPHGRAVRCRWQGFFITSASLNK